MKKTINDLLGFEDICNEQVLFQKGGDALAESTCNFAARQKEQQDAFEKTWEEAEKREAELRGANGVVTPTPTGGK